VIFAVFDTNVLAACAVASSGALATLLQAWRRGDVRVVVSSHILGELDRALDNDYFAKRLSANQRQVFLDRLAANTTMIVITTPIPTVVSTLGDNLVLATAESAGAPYLITGDRELLRIARYKATEILTPRQFGRVLEMNSPSDNGA
jgi:putative PIN family toxin of toxin-antitoxin system